MKETSIQQKPILSGLQLASIYLLAALCALSLIFLSGCSKQKDITPTQDGGASSSIDPNNPACLIDTDKDGVMNCVDPDSDGDGQNNDIDTDDDGDGDLDSCDLAPLNPSVGCPDEVKDECKTDGEWVPLINEDGSPGKSLADCITKRSYADSIDVEIKWCVDHRDALTISGSYLYLRSFSRGRGDIGAFPGLHKDCPAEFKDKATVKVTTGSQTENFTWKFPAFSYFNLGLGEMDITASSALSDITQTAGGNRSVSYTNLYDVQGRYVDRRETPGATPGASSTSNNAGNGILTHMVAFEDTAGGAAIYGIKFKYSYKKIDVGSYN